MHAKRVQVAVNRKEDAALVDLPEALLKRNYHHNISTQEIVHDFFHYCAQNSLDPKREAIRQMLRGHPWMWMLLSDLGF